MFGNTHIDISYSLWQHYFIAIYSIATKIEIRDSG